MRRKAELAAVPLALGSRRSSLKMVHWTILSASRTAPHGIKPPRIHGDVSLAGEREIHHLDAAFRAGRRVGRKRGNAVQAGIGQQRDVETGSLNGLFSEP